MAAEIKNVIFDMGQVLLTFTPEGILAPHFPEEERREAARRVIFESGDWALTDTGRVEEETLLARWIAALPGEEEALRALMARWYDAMEPVAGMTELVAELREAGYRCFLLSNTSPRFGEYAHRHQCLRMLDGCLISGELGIVKPDPAIFRALLERFDLRGEECFFVDDAPRNVAGAAACGIRGFCFEGYDVSALRRAMRNEGIRIGET